MMSSSVADIPNHDEEEDLSIEVNQQPSAKKRVKFNHLGLPVGPNATRFKARLGKFVKTYVPISYKSWSDVPDNFKDDAWNALTVAKRGGSLVTRTGVRLENHTRKDKSILPSAISFVEKVKTKIDESKQSEGNNSGIHPLSTDDDPLTQVFGKKSKGLPGIGSFVSKNKYNATLHAQIMYSEERGEKEGLEKKIDKMQTQVDHIAGYFKMMGGSITPTPLPEVTPMPTCEVSPTLAQATMNIAQGPPTGGGDSATSTSIEPTRISRWCELLDWDMNCVAIAKEVTDPMHKDMCHNHRLNEHEMKVSMCVQKMNFAKLYKETPDAKTIQEVGVGDFLVWPKVYIKFTEH